MTSFTRMNWTAVELLSSSSAVAAGSDPSATFFYPNFAALRRERLGAQRIANLKWLCVGGCISWVGFIFLSL